MHLETLSEHASFGGSQGIYRHRSTAVACAMEFSVYLPPQARSGPVPVLYWLSGLTCTWANFTEKAGAQRYAAEHGLIVVCPDTSPRGTDLPGEHEAYDFGSGAGFYVDATQPPWSGHYRMYSYVSEELPALIADRFPAAPGRQGIFGHSMGGHGALVIAFRNPDRYRSLSAFAPIAAPARCPWGRKAFAGYLGPDEHAWRQYDATALAEGGPWCQEILVDQGSRDQFLEEQLQPDTLVVACRRGDIPLRLRMQDGYDHSYYFIATFLADHIAHHASLLRD